MNEKICLIAGVGPGTGKETAKKFSDSGYKVVMLARNIDFINSLILNNKKCNYAKELAEHALNKGSLDNITVIVYFFN